MPESRALRGAYEDLKTGRISRRSFLERAAALGVAAPLALFLARSHGAVAQEGAETDAPRAPSAGTEMQRRGAGGVLKIISTLRPGRLAIHSTSSEEDILAASLVTEPLFHFLPDGSLVPCLASDVPSFENGLLARDLRSVTYRLREGVVWSDGQPFTADDVVFTWKWITDPASPAWVYPEHEWIESVEAIDELTVKVTFPKPRVDWMGFFASSARWGIYPAHILSAGPEANEAFYEQPIGTGPYVVEAFDPEYGVNFGINERYREPNKPYFSGVTIQGVEDPVAAARLVLRDGEADIATPVRISSTEIGPLSANTTGTLAQTPGYRIEHIEINFSDPYTEVDGERSNWRQPHPFLTEKVVRQALSLGIDRAAIAALPDGFSPYAWPTGGIFLPGVPDTGTRDEWEFDIAKGEQLLEDAGWKLDNGVRAKDGVPLKLRHLSYVDHFEMAAQPIVVEGWKAMGFEVEPKMADHGIFFNNTRGNDWGFLHFNSDVQQYAFGPSVWVHYFLARWYSDDGANIAQKENDWGQSNSVRYNNPDYDALYEALVAETDLDRAADLVMQLVELLVDDVVTIPIARWASARFAVANRLRQENIAAGQYESLSWNIANWNEVPED